MNSEDIELLFKTFKHNFPKYSSMVLHIKTKKGSCIKFVFNRAQKHIWENFILPDLKAGRPLRYIFLKARQLGISTFIAALIYWIISLNKFKGALITSHDNQSAENLFLMQKTFYKFSPNEIRPMMKISNRKELFFTNPDESAEPGLESRIVVQTAENSEIGRSFTLQFAHCSELASWEKNGYEPKVRMSALKQAIPDEPGTGIFIESTAQGEGYFKEIWDDKDSDYRKIFISWIADDNYRKEISPLDYFELSAEDDHKYGNEELEFENIEREVKFWYPEYDSNSVEGCEKIYHEIMCRLAWRRWCIDNKCEKDVYIFYREYPTTPDQAFMVSGESVFPFKPLLQMKRNSQESTNYKFNIPIIQQFRYIDIKKKELVNELVEKSFIPDNRGTLKVFYPPNEKDRYVIAADTAQGIKDGDDSAIVVLQVPDLVEVAQYNEVIHPDLFAYILYSLGYLYNRALLAVEIDDKGSTAVMNILQRKLFYPNLYVRETLAETKDFKKTEKKFGWRTTGYTKPIMISDACQLIRDSEITFNSMDTIKQFMNYKKLPDDTFGCPPGQKDDVATAAMIAVQIAKNVRIETEKEKKKIRKWSANWWMKLIEDEQLGEFEDD